MDRGTRWRAVVYVGALTATLGAIVGPGLLDGADLGGDLGAWCVLVSLFAITEYVDLSFHYRGARVGITSCEAVLLPLIAGFSFEGIVLGVIVAMGVVRTLRWRGGWLKWAFNVSAYGLAAAGAVKVWDAFEVSTVDIDGTTLVAMVAAGLTFAVTSHFLTAVILAIVEGRSVWLLTRSMAGITLLNVAGNLALGALFVAAYSGAPGAVLFFPIPLAGLQFGLRAIIRQTRERERVQKLYEATRALVAGPDASSALVGFLTAVAHVMSTSDAHLVRRSRGVLVHTFVAEECLTTMSEKVDAESPFTGLVQEVDRSGTVILTEDDHSELVAALGVRNAIAVRVPHGQDTILCATGRVGADEFDRADLRLLEALAQELALALESHRMFSEVEEEKARFQSIFASSKEGIALVDADGTVAAWNPALGQITGIPESAAIGQSWAQLVRFTDEEGRIVGSMRIFDRVGEFEVLMTSRVGIERWVSLLPAGLAGDDPGLVVLVRDVSAQHEAERAKGDFLATISHELRTPLTSIKGSLLVLDRPDEDVPDAVRRQMVEVMRRGSDRLERLLLNLLFVSQVEAQGRVDVLPDRIDLLGLVGELCADGQVAVHMPDERLYVRADRERLTHSLGHILDNAMKYGSGCPIEVRVEEHGAHAHVWVSDEGPGIPVADRERVFDRFVRLGEVMTRDVQGAGVGLYIARESIRAMGGDVWIEDNPSGRGVTFHMRLRLDTLPALGNGSRLARNDRAATAASDRVFLELPAGR